MAKMNPGRVILGGLVAGVVIDVIEGLTHGVFLASRDAELMTSLNRPAAGSANQIIALNVWGLALGFLTIWLYAAIRPRMGAGPKTAVCAGVFMWTIVSLMATAIPLITGIYRLDLSAINMGVELVMLTVAALAGAAVYKENSGLARSLSAGA